MYVCNAMLSHIPCLFSSFLRCSASFLFHLIVNFFFFFLFLVLFDSAFLIIFFVLTSV